MGAEPLLKAFIVVILGGLGSLIGTVVGAYLVGFVEAVSMSVIGLYGTPAVLFLLMIVVLMVKPNGLLGKD
jgi:branched-chain amino acid transport system permease protein